TAPLTVGPNSVFPVPPAALIPIDPTVGAGTLKIMRLVVLGSGGGADPHVIFKVDSGDEVEVTPTGFTFPVYSQPGTSGEAIDVIMTLDDPTSIIYKLELFIVGAFATCGIRIKNTDAAVHGFTWVVADSDADSQQAWIDADTALTINVL